MKRERIEDLGCIKILIEEALDCDLFEDIRSIEYLLSAPRATDKWAYGIYSQINDLKIKLEQIQDYSKGFEDV